MEKIANTNPGNLGTRLKAHISKGAYTGGKRDARLDFLRGLAVLVMVIDHVGGDDSLFYLLTSNDHFFISAAEAFVLISGLVMGMVYSRIVAHMGLRAAMVKAFQRASTLYLLTIVVTLGFAALSLRLNLPWAPNLSPNGIVDFVFGVFTLQRVFYLTDILLLYTLLVLCAIPMLALMARRRTVMALAASGGLWTLWQWWPEQFQLPWAITDSLIFNFAAWQLIFFTALAIGYHREALAPHLARLPKLAVLGVSGALFAGSIAFFLRVQQASVNNREWVLNALFMKEDVQLGRLLVLAFFTIFAYTLLTLFWGPIKRVIGWLVLPLGRQALSAYTLHLLVISVLAFIVLDLAQAESLTRRENTLLQAIGVLLVWGLVFAWSALRKVGTDALDKILSTKEHIHPKSGTRARKTGREPHRVPASIRLALVGTSALSAVVLALGMLTADVALLSYDDVSYAHREAGVTQEHGSAGGSGSTGSGTTARVRRATPQPTVFGKGPRPAPSPTPEISTLIPAGVRVESLLFKSETLGRTMPYVIYLPPGYDEAVHTRYPVLYMLHGMGGSNIEWINYGLLSRADEVIRNKQMEPLLIVLPQGDQSYWFDHPNGGPKWGTYLAQDMVREIDTRFRTLPSRERRAVGGISMGGHAALQLSINFSEVFGVVGAHSPSLHSYKTANPVFGDAAYFAAHDPIHLLKSYPSIARTQKIWIDLGVEDDWLDTATALHHQMEKDAIPHEWHVFNGGHMPEYWSDHVLDYLNFYAINLRLEVPD